MMNISVPNYQFNVSINRRRKSPNPEQLKFANDWIRHYIFLDSQKMRRIESADNFGAKKKKYNFKKREYQDIVLKAIKKRSLKLNDRGNLKIRLWPRFDEYGNKLHDKNGIVIKIERYDILAFVRMLVAAKELGDDIFYDFLSIYDVKQIMNNINEDYFGDLKLFLTRRSL